MQVYGTSKVDASKTTQVNTAVIHKTTVDESMSSEGKYELWI